MPITLGSSVPTNLKLGSTQISKVFQGDNLVWPVGGTGDYILDKASGAVLAYSVRKLSAGYTGDCMKVKRMSDNAVLDIGFVGDDLDTTSILNFVGNNDGEVFEWYDQTGNGNDAYLGTGLIVSNGTLVTDDVGRPTMNLLGDPATLSVRGIGYGTIGTQLYPDNVSSAGHFMRLSKSNIGTTGGINSFTNQYVMRPSGLRLYFSALLPYDSTEPGINIRYWLDTKRSGGFNPYLRSSILIEDQSYNVAVSSVRGLYDEIYFDGSVVARKPARPGTIDTAGYTGHYVMGGGMQTGMTISERIDYVRDMRPYISFISENMGSYYS